MDFLDPKLHRRHTVLLYVGYVFIALAILIGTLILMNIAYGFGLGKHGEVVQNGFLYMSSTPAGADIRLNGKLQGAQTNTRLSLPEATYHTQLDRPGYRSWQRDIPLLGGSVMRFDYPLLIPTKLKSTSLKTYASAPLTTQSPDRRWLLVQHAEDQTVFDLFDLKNKTQPFTTFTLPASIVSSGADSSWQLDEWSTDNQHVILQHNYAGKSEYVLIDRNDPTQSLNLNDTLGVNPSKVSLVNKKFDQYYVYDATSQVLSTATLNNPKPVNFLEHVLAYQSYGSDVMLYASSSASSAAKVSIDLLQSGKTYALREVPAGTTYLLNLTKYSGDWYVALGASSENKVYVYKNPVTQLGSKLGVLTPTFIMKTPAPTYLAFSNSAQYLMDENGSQFSVYDFEYEKGYTYDTTLPLDAPQPHASWMDGNRLTYVSGGKLVMFDYDHTNVQPLVGALPGQQPVFDPSYKYLDLLNTSADGKVDLTVTPLRVAADL